MKCPTCGRRPSERGIRWVDKAGNVVRESPFCPDPIHDLADQAPALLEALENFGVPGIHTNVCVTARCGGACDCMYGIARAAILKAKGGE